MAFWQRKHQYLPTLQNACASLLPASTWSKTYNESIRYCSMRAQWNKIFKSSMYLASVDNRAQPLMEACSVAQGPQLAALTSSLSLVGFIARQSTWAVESGSRLLVMVCGRPLSHGKRMCISSLSPTPGRPFTAHQDSPRTNLLPRPERQETLNFAEPSAYDYCHDNKQLLRHHPLRSSCLAPCFPTFYDDTQPVRNPSDQQLNPPIPARNRTVANMSWAGALELP